MLYLSFANALLLGSLTNLLKENLMHSKNESLEEKGLRLLGEQARSNPARFAKETYWGFIPFVVALLVAAYFFVTN